MTDQLLPSWRDGATRSAVVDFLDAADEIPHERRVAVFDNDGTLWCEKPRYTQLDFFVWELNHAVKDRPALQSVPEYAAVLGGDMAEVQDIGLPRVAVALVALFEKMEPEAFEARVRAFFDETRHPDSGLRYDQMVYQPMLELMQALEDRGFTNCIVTGGGTEFVRAISRRVYGVDQERVVGTLVRYTLADRNGRRVLVRTSLLEGEVNEGEAKISNIQMALGRQPSLAAGNSPGDADMLEYTNSLDEPSLALLVNHDDAEREYAYRSEAGSFDAEEAVEATATTLGWTQISMRDDWATVFPDP
ncbi:MAG: haloacid dehalogenase-like hydrolase [Acidimicrobiia bacterium]|nr:haloacid dehalogenase-like hydrolase [Acidimicrobiia bacterium]